MSNNGKSGEDHWLTRPATIKMLRSIAIAALVLLVLADASVEHHPHFAIEGTFAFGAWMGFVSCGLLIIVARALGALLQRPGSYYDN